MFALAALAAQSPAPGAAHAFIALCIIGAAFVISFIVWRRSTLPTDRPRRGRSRFWFF